ncbi:hypothetical protein RHOFW104T7_07000 [Rhodanobacter thiooxydans]|uniref:Uncharacterized protein n=1 Tax=Rhodanobacter thiooxydans TaxID=416169 RepID=A0A154QKR6_9GAMM|nr:hypothetical protein RHOFW104T7_07000 [Rhodanobacter thiooxydans]
MKPAMLCMGARDQSANVFLPLPGRPTLNIVCIFLAGATRRLFVRLIRQPIYMFSPYSICRAM